MSITFFLWSSLKREKTPQEWDCLAAASNDPMRLEGKYWDWLFELDSMEHSKSVKSVKLNRLTEIKCDLCRMRMCIIYMNISTKYLHSFQLLHALSYKHDISSIMNYLHKCSYWEDCSYFGLNYIMKPFTSDVLPDDETNTLFTSKCYHM